MKFTLFIGDFGVFSFRGGATILDEISQIGVLLGKDKSLKTGVIEIIVVSEETDNNLSFISANLDIVVEHEILDFRSRYTAILGRIKTVEKSHR
jgi:hypothetical protein